MPLARMRHHAPETTILHAVHAEKVLERRLRHEASDHFEDAHVHWPHTQIVLQGHPPGQ